MTDTIDIVKSRLPRRAMMNGVGLSAAAAVLAAGSRAAMAAGTGPFPAHPRWKFSVINHATTIPFFLPTQYGLHDACELFGCTYQWTGSQTSDVSQMVNAMNVAVAGKVDAIGIAIIDPKAFNDPTARAMDAGIPVFSYNADAPAGSANRRLAYIGQDLFLSGQMMGERILKLVKSGPIALFIATPGQLNLQPRIDGAIAAIKKSGRNLKYDIIATDPSPNVALSKIQAYYLGHQNVKGLFAVDSHSTQGVAEVMQQYGLPKKGVVGGGFDLLPRTLQLINQGYADFAIDQEPYLQGFYMAMEMFMFKASGGLVGPADINTGLQFVTRKTVKPYLTTKTRYEGSAATSQIVPRTGPIG